MTCPVVLGEKKKAYCDIKGSSGLRKRDESFEWKEVKYLLTRKDEFIESDHAVSVLVHFLRKAKHWSAFLSKVRCQEV